MCCEKHEAAATFYPGELQLAERQLHPPTIPLPGWMAIGWASTPVRELPPRPQIEPNMREGWRGPKGAAQGVLGVWDGRRLAVKYSA